MKNILTLTLLLLCVFSTAAMAQDSTSISTKSTTKQGVKRGPVFRATKDQINAAQSKLKAESHYSGEQTGKLDDATRAGLKKYQEAEGVKVTGTLNKLTLEKMGITLTEKQRTM